VLGFTPTLGQSRVATEEVNMINCWGKEVYKGEQIIIGKYYKRQGHSLMSYVLCDGGPTFIYSHLMIITKFNMVVA
jgi:hypothetical protein